MSSNSCSHEICDKNYCIKCGAISYKNVNISPFIILVKLISLNLADYCKIYKIFIQNRIISIKIIIQNVKRKSQNYK